MTTLHPSEMHSIDTQINELERRGLIINDYDITKNFLKNVSYFRLQSFWNIFHISTENLDFRKGTTFNQLIQLYNFDRKLRLLLFDAIERVEIAFRTKVIYYFSIELGKQWFEENQHFFNIDYHAETLSEIDIELKRTKEAFIKAHYIEHTNRPPAYKTLEVISFGCLSKIYSNVINDIKAKNRVAKELNLPNHTILRSWLRSFNIIRNIIAHHNRVWNRKIDSPPKYLRKPKADFIDKPSDLHSMYHCISCLLYILNAVAVNHNLQDRLVTLFNENQSIDLSKMGFPTHWRTQKIWQSP